jgi:hypothetical protein
MRKPTKEQAGRVLLEALGAHAGAVGGGGATIKSAIGAGGAVPPGSAFAEVLAGRAAPPEVKPPPEPIRRVPSDELAEVIRAEVDRQVKAALVALGVDPAKVKL